MSYIISLFNDNNIIIITGIVIVGVCTSLVTKSLYTNTINRLENDNRLLRDELNNIANPLNDNIVNNSIISAHVPDNIDNIIEDGIVIDEITISSNTVMDETVINNVESVVNPYEYVARYLLSDNNAEIVKDVSSMLTKLIAPTNYDSFRNQFTERVIEINNMVDDFHLERLLALFCFVICFGGIILISEMTNIVAEVINADTADYLIIMIKQLLLYIVDYYNNIMSVWCRRN